MPSFPRAGGAGSVQVTAGAGCPWTAVSTVPWISIVSPGNGNGNGSFAFNVAANTTGTRMGVITVATATVTVTQQ
jgi:hypothetical protein